MKILGLTHGGKVEKCKYVEKTVEHIPLVGEKHKKPLVNKYF